MFEKLIHIDQELTLFLNGSDSLFLDGIASTATATLTWIPLAIVFLYIVIKNNDMLNIFLVIIGMALCIFIADQTASTIFKPWICRFRPTNNPELMYLVDVVNDYRGGKYGFFSSHAANTFSVAIFSSLLMRHRSFTFWIFTWALLNCWTRVYLGVHYVGDLTVGALFGLLVGSLVYGIYYRLGNHKTEVLRYHSDIQTTTGYLVADVRFVNLTLVCTYLTVIYLGILAK